MHTTRQTRTVPRSKPARAVRPVVAPRATEWRSKPPSAIYAPNRQPRGQGKTHSYQTPEEMTSGSSATLAPILRPKGQGKTHSFPTLEEMTSIGTTTSLPCTAQRPTATLSGRTEKRQTSRTKPPPTAHLRLSARIGPCLDMKCTLSHRMTTRIAKLPSPTTQTLLLTVLVMRGQGTIHKYPNRRTRASGRAQPQMRTPRESDARTRAKVAAQTDASPKGGVVQNVPPYSTWKPSQESTEGPRIYGARAASAPEAPPPRHATSASADGATVGVTAARHEALPCVRAASTAGVLAINSPQTP